MGPGPGGRQHLSNHGWVSGCSLCSPLIPAILCRLPRTPPSVIGPPSDSLPAHHRVSRGVPPAASGLYPGQTLGFPGARTLQEQPGKDLELSFQPPYLRDKTPTSTLCPVQSRPTASRKGLPL